MHRILGFRVLMCIVFAVGVMVDNFQLRTSNKNNNEK